MNYFSIVIYLFILMSCDTKIDNSYEKYKKFSIYYKGKTTLIISCLKCDCIIDELNKITKKDSTLLNNIDIYIDTECKSYLSKRIKTINIKQNTIDSLSTDFYNMLLIKDSNKIYQITTPLAKKISDYLIY